MIEPIYFVGNPKELNAYLGDMICEECRGEGVVYTSVLVRGDNLAPEGMFEFEPRTCECQRLTSDREEE